MGVVSVDLVVPGAAEIDALEGVDLDHALKALQQASDEVAIAVGRLLVARDRADAVGDWRRVAARLAGVGVSRHPFRIDPWS